MGLFTAAVIYRYAKRRAEREHQLDDEFWSEICNNCGYERRQHAQDETESCPVSLEITIDELEN